ncbi:MAG: GGDEF domain-containing protein [Pseudomonadota bacterium]|jgi:diguanylate cyclase|nr:GGDEF domain-containing protein [Rubrivivax sp.]MCA3258255.1 GGDEF domain-containing protein [Rubrivivax sp.]MCE2913212.1 GGDEF domain-containing protein [Rubrivivax sp.]MCZ8030665.1 GGDEF domain-containing protein [Rubrivivax sp.]
MSAAASRRYSQSRERSAELLRLALAGMGKNPAALDPLCYAVWYEHVAGLNPGLSRALLQGEGKTAPLDDEAVVRLYRDHIAPPDADDVARVGLGLQQTMQRLERSASQAGDHAGEFGAQLDSLNDLLEASSVESLAERLPGIARATAQASASIRSLQQELAGSRREIDRLREELDRTRAETLLDPLTGVMNRRGFDRRLAEVLCGHHVEHEPPCLLMFDIDHFKRVNDQHGHMVGDLVIQGVGQILRQAATRHQSSAARCGGEEFAFLLPRANRDEALRVAQSICEQAKGMQIRQRSTGNCIGSITLSGGVAHWRTGEDAAALTARADAALYRSKQEGRDRVSVAA